MDDSTQTQERKKKPVGAIVPPVVAYTPTPEQMQLFARLRANAAGIQNAGNPPAPAGVQAVPMGNNQVPAINPQTAPFNQYAALGPHMPGVAQPQQSGGIAVVDPSILGRASITPDEYSQRKSFIRNNIGALADRQMDQYRQLGDNFMMPEQYKQSPFEQKLSEGMEKRMLDLVSDRKTPMERFNRGYDFGQKLAADVIVPAFGSFTRSGGRAMGALEASNMLSQASQAADNLRAQKQQIHNQVLANLASMYEGMNPNSAKNLMAYAQLKTQAQQHFRQQQNEAGKNALQGYVDENKAYQDLDSLQVKDQARQDKSVLGARNIANKERQTDINEGNVNSLIDTRDQRTQQGDKRLLIEGNKANTYANSVANTNSNAGLNRRQSAQKQDASMMKSFIHDLTVTGANGLLKYPNAASFYKNNPAELENWENIHAEAGGKTLIKDWIDRQFAQREAQLQQPSHGGINLDTVNGVLNQVMGKASPDEGKSVLPTRAAPSMTSSAINGFSPSQQATSAASNKNYDYLVHEFATDFEKTNGRRPTKAEMQEALRGYMPNGK